MERADGVQRIYRGLAASSRRAAVRARSGASPLTQVEHSLLAQVGEQPGLHAADHARLLQLNRSTTTRQLTALAARGLLIHSPGEGRQQPIDLTPAGRVALAEAEEAHLAQMRARLEHWTAEQVEAFAAALEAFNAGRPPAG